MSNTAKRLARLFAFGLALLLVIALSNVFLVRTDAMSVMTLREMYARDDIELAFIGSSVVREHVNPAIIEEKTGLTSFNAAFLSASLPADIAVATELFAHHDPQWTVLVIEPYTLNTAKEYTETQFMIMNHLKSPRVKLEYYLRLCAQDGLYIDRALMFRTFYPQSLGDLGKTVGMWLTPETTFARIQAQTADQMQYMGAGFARVVSEASARDMVRQRMMRLPDPGYTYELLAPSREMLLEFKALCEAEGTNLMIVCVRNHTSHVLSEPEYLPYARSLRAFCAENGIACYDLTLAKPSLMPNLDAYYADLYHMRGEGADLFSAALGDMLARAMAGEDLSGEFYEDDAQMLAACDFITNTWITRDEDEGNRYRADCNTGTLVVPEYRFELIGADGASTLLRDYSADAEIVCDIPEGSDLRVLARPQGGAQDADVYYDYPTDYEAYFGEV